MKKRSKISSGNLFFRCEIRGIADLIYDALKNNDVDLLRGLQSFATSLWTWTHGGSTTLSYLIRRTVEERQKKREERARWEKEKYQITPEEQRKLFSDKIGFSLEILREDMRNLSTTMSFINGFEKLGFVEIIDENPPEYKNDPRGVMVYLTPVWDTALDTLYYKKEETEVFSGAIGRLLALSIWAEEGRRAIGLNRFKIAATLCGIAENNNGKIPAERFSEIFVMHHEPKGKAYEMISYDNQKVRNIRFVKSNDGKKIVIKKESLLAYKRIHERGLELMRAMQRGV
ncbi:MAG: hypothetical protein KKA79_01855 [Nanoarchaeota archaeon]|nr:hypothetical protein [Nanoarchaeota archaeon]MCG2717674.1 hypothetical protein [Nanoarchaeota archaeon]